MLIQKTTRNNHNRDDNANSFQMEAAEGVTFEAGRMGTYTIEKDPTRENGLRVLMGPFTVYNKDNVEAAAQ